MKWIAQDIEQYLKAQDYIDTAVVSLIPVAFGTEMKQAALEAEFITLVSTLIERQFTGRILLLPPYTYLSSADQEKRLKGLNEWVLGLKNNQLKHVFLLTCDSQWNFHKNQLAESLIWLPVIQLENLENSQKISIIENQVPQLMAIFTRKWQENRE